MDSSGILHFAIYFLTSAGIYSILALGLNIQWGYSGLLNIGIAGFYAIGAYISVFLTSGVGLAGKTVGMGLPFPIAFLGAMVGAGIIAFLLGVPSLGLEKGYLAITLLGFGEIVRLVAVNEKWLTNGSMGFSGIHRPLQDSLKGFSYEIFLMILVIFCLASLYFVVNRSHRSPWGRTLKAIREDEAAAMMQGKNTFAFKLQAFALGAAIMGGAGSLYAHYISYINPSSFTSELTFLIWIMLIVGGSGNDLGALLGSITIWGFYVISNFILDFVPASLTARLGGLRVMFIAGFFVYMLIKRPEGILKETKWISRVNK